MVKVLASKADFDEQLHSVGDKLVVVDFHATWCGPCLRIAPFIETLVKKYPDVVFAKVDVDANAETSKACGISCMPTFHFYKNGTKVDQLEGASDTQLEALVTKNM